MSRITSQSLRESNPQTALRIAVTCGTVGFVASATGWALEWYRQRGTCEFGNNSPDTLGISVVLILLGGGALGVVAVIAWLAGRLRGSFSDGWVALATSGASVLSAAAIFYFAGAGAGSWFQNCGT